MSFSEYTSSINTGLLSRRNDLQAFFIWSEGFISPSDVKTAMLLNKPRLAEQFAVRSRGSVKMIRVSSGSAVVLGLIDAIMDTEPTAAYLLTYSAVKCYANCGFCSQARSSRSRADMLSRVAWPAFPTREVIPRLVVAVQRKAIKRVCIQALNYSNVMKDLVGIVKEICRLVKVPISVSCQPVVKEDMLKLKEAGVERIGVPLDAATRHIFDNVKGRFVEGPYSWERQREALLKALEIFGKNSVSTHLIIGLGETEKEMIDTVQWCIDNGIYPALFSFTPIPGTPLERNPQPSISSYRRIQLARHLIAHGKTRFEKMRFDKIERIVDYGVSEGHVKDAVQSGKPFRTSGCPNCNRPYYNERPSGPLYNFPRQLTSLEIREVAKQLKSNS